MHLKETRCVLVAAILAHSFFAPGPLRAQAAAAGLSGRITNSSGAAVPGAKISVKNESTEQSIATETDPKGTYRLSNLAPGDYEFSVSAKGYNSRTIRLKLTSGNAQTANLVLVSALSQEAEPSLADLGFSPTQTKGSNQYQAMLDKRSHMLQVHQRLGLITMAPLLATLISSPGAKGKHGNPGSPSGREIHAALGSATVALYFSSAYFAMRAPKIPNGQVHGPIRVHKALAWIHGPGMVLTPILGAIAYSQLSSGERIHGIAKYHSWVAWTTVGAYGAAIASVSIKF